VGSIAQDSTFIPLYGRLTDKFGDNGLVAVLIGKIVDDSLQLDLWLMSCRVLKREMEFAMFDALVEQCQERGIHKILGTYIPSKKNSMVAGHYADLGFKSIGSSDGRQLWSYEVPATYSPRTRYIRRTVEAPQTSPISDGASVASEV
jgi:predicted enzyme involved in methoxymalonyl-ACP biosynthesis